MIKCESSNLKMFDFWIFMHTYTHRERKKHRISPFFHTIICVLCDWFTETSRITSQQCVTFTWTARHTHFRWLVAKHFFLIRAWLSRLSRLVWFPVRKSKLEKDTQSVQFYIQIELNRTAIAYSTFIESGHPFAWND